MSRLSGARGREEGLLGWSWWQWALALTAAATVLGLVTVLEAHARALMWGEPPAPFWSAVKSWMPDYYIWAALTPLIVWLGHRFPLERESLLPHLGLHLVLSGLFVTFELVLSCAVVAAIVPDQPPESYSFWQWYVRILARFFVWGVLIYWVIQAAGHAVRWHRRSREQELAASELEAELARAQLRSLRMQLHPHFFFNTLHSIAVLVRKNDRSAALEMLTGLGDLLRHSLETADRQEVPLKEELEFLERYLDIEQIRFRDRLRVRWEVDAAAYDAAVPNMILQPLVENAVQHGVAPSVRRRTVEIEARCRDDVLELGVRDDGPGVPEDWSPSQADGVGLRNVRERLHKLHGDAAALRVGPAEGGGVRATVRLPFRRFGADGDGPEEPDAADEEMALAAGGLP